MIAKDEGRRNGEKTSEREINADSSCIGEKIKQKRVKPRKPKRVVALKGRPSFSPKVHVNTNLCASE